MTCSAPSEDASAAVSSCTSDRDLPDVRPIVRAFDIAIGHCRGCGRRVQGRHPLQTSDAIGAASAQVGPAAVTLAVVLNKQLGLPLGKIAMLFRERFGLMITPGGLVHAIRRAARCARRTTVYAIQPGRGFREAASVLGNDFEGILVRDGWAPYRRFDQAIHQTCLAHFAASVPDTDSRPSRAPFRAARPADFATRPFSSASSMPARSSRNCFARQHRSPRAPRSAS